MEEKKLIEFRNIVKNFDGQIVLKGINLDIYENEFVTLLGPSGCGKTTLLRILGGFLDADEGSVIFDGEEISKKPPYERELNTVFQKYALFPHLSVYENIAFGLKIKKMSKDVIDQKVMKMLKLIGLEGFEDKNTTLLSAGMCGDGLHTGREDAVAKRGDTGVSGRTAVRDLSRSLGPFSKAGGSVRGMTARRTSMKIQEEKRE